MESKAYRLPDVKANGGATYALWPWVVADGMGGFERYGTKEEAERAMRRPSTKEYWRVESEMWDLDLDDDNVYLGAETFLGGASVPHDSLRSAEIDALAKLRLGYWVKMEHYP